MGGKNMEMQEFNLERLNNKRERMGYHKIELSRTSYRKPIIVNDRLVDANGNPIGTKGDMFFKKTLDYILQDGCMDNYPRPVYKDRFEDAKYDEENGIIKCDMAFITDDESERNTVIKTFANTARTYDCGTHLNAFKNVYKDCLNAAKRGSYSIGIFTTFRYNDPDKEHLIKYFKDLYYKVELFEPGLIKGEKKEPTEEELRFAPYRQYILMLRWND
jgi:hypothetical protein